MSQEALYGPGSGRVFSPSAAVTLGFAEPMQ
jgi:hypothetical protein